MAQEVTLNAPHHTVKDTPKLALVTGGGAGIGREIARAFADDGWNVHICGRTATKLEETAAQAPERITWSVCDITDEQAVAEMYSELAQQYPRLDVAVINAGLPGTPAEFGDVSLDDFRATVDTNIVGSFLTARQAFRAMRDQDPAGGRIIVNCSIAAQVPRPGTASYGTSKAGLKGMTHVLALDGRAHGIAVTRIDIGNAATNLLGSFTSAEPMFEAATAAQAFVYAANLPANAVVDELTITACGMPFLGRG